MRFWFLLLLPFVCLADSKIAPANRIAGANRIADANRIAGANKTAVLGGNPPDTFYSTSATFDGTADYMTLSTLATGLADAKTFTLSVWLNFNGGDAASQVIYRNNSDRLVISKNASNQIDVVGANSAGTPILDFNTSVTKVAADGWFHLYICIDMANSANRHVYFNGAEDASVTWTTYTNDTLDLESGSHRIGADGSGTSKLNSDASELWFDDTYLNDTTKFVNSCSPISLGTQGETPTGTTPVFYFSQVGSGDNWAFDSSANANDMTVTGALVAASTEPSCTYGGKLDFSDPNNSQYVSLAF